MNKYIQDEIDKIVEWLRDKVQNSLSNGLIVGLSGGVDSAVVACLIKKAFPDDSLAIIMPCKGDPEDEQEAVKAAEACGIEYINVELAHTHDILLKDIMEALEGQKNLDLQKSRRIADANLRARLRMGTMYCVANFLNYLVVGTDNAAEMYTGYFTKYGDGGVDLLPIVNLKKREVYEWGRYLGVPESILNRPPSAGLWEGQTDEAEMGTTYDMVDDFLDGKEIPQRDKEIIERLHKKSEHKREMPSRPPIK